MSGSIWFNSELNLEEVSKRGEGTMLEHIGIELVEIGPDFLRARMPVDHRTKQPIGILNGGASLALAESVASTAGNFCVDLDKEYCVGLEINGNHLRSVRDGYVVATAKPFHLGRSTHVWDVQIHHKDKLICVSRMTLMVKQRS